jgi:TolB-like protein
VPDVFLSYNREDQAAARRFAEAFAGQGLDVWWDTALKSGEAYDEVTETALRTAKAVVVLWSKKSVVSRWVRAEATLADRNKTLVPCMIEPCERPIMFELTQTAELSHWNGAADDRAWQAFLADVRRFVGREAPVAPAPARVVAAPQAPKSERGEKPSLAIMPFANRSGVAEDDGLAFGMAEDIVSAISLSPDIRVLAAGSTQRWAGKPADLREVGRDLDVRYVLEGNLRRAGANLRVTVQLVEAETGAILWNQKFERLLSELAALQEDLVTEVTGNLGVAVQNLEIERVLKKPGDITAYEACQRAWALIGRLRPDEVTRGIAEARRAISITPDYGMAYGLLAMGLILNQRLHPSVDPALTAETMAHVQRAVELSPKDSNTLSLASFVMLGMGQPREALRHAQRAVRMNPNNGLAYGTLGFAQVTLGLNEEAIASLDANYRLSPGDFGFPAAQSNRAIANYQLGRLQQAIEATDRALTFDPAHATSLMIHAALCTLVGKADDASDAIRRLRTGYPSVPGNSFASRISTMPDMTQPTGPALVEAFRKAWDETPETSE